MKRHDIIYALCAGLLVLATSFQAYAQKSKTITGNIVDENGEAVIGASILIKGTNQGAVTDIDGNYTVTVPEGSILEISCIGFKTQTVTAGQSPLNILMEEDRNMLEEVVVVGYGEQKAKHITASIETVSMNEIQDLAVSNLGDALTGMVNGLHVNATGNRPGEASHLTIRQSEGLAKNNGQVNAKFSVQDDTPLYIIDDFFSTEAAFNALDPSEVESISVLKDAAAAIYGAQGAYGVILVKTKRGHQGKPKISYSGQFGVTDALVMPKMMSAYDYARTWNGYMGTPDYANNEIAYQKIFQADELEAMKNIAYNPLSEEWHAALTQRHGVNVNGGTERFTYFAGFTYNTQDGNVGKLEYNRYNYRAGVSVKLNDWMKTDFQVSGNYGSKKTPVNKYGSSNSGDYLLLLHHLPFVPMMIGDYPIVYQGMTETNTASGDNLYNFYAVQNARDYNSSNNNGFNLNAAFEIDMGFWKPLRGLKLRASYTKDISNSESNSIATSMAVYQLNKRGGTGGHLYQGNDIEGNPLDFSLAGFTALSLDNGNRLTRRMSRADSYQFNLTANYVRDFGLHHLAAMASFERGENWAEDIEGIVLSPLPFTDGQSNSATGAQSSNWGRTESGRMSYLGRLNYNYAEKYLFEASIRTDASNKFAPANYWGVFPSIQAGWIVSEEDWFKNSVSALDYLKLRASWGILGRDNINSYVWMTRYNRDVTSGNGMVFGSNSMDTNLSAGMSIEQGGANPDAHWDKTYKHNAGIEARALNSRLSITVDGYFDKGREIFGSHQGTKYFPMTVGIKPTPENFVAKDMYGVEVSLGWNDNIGNDFSYWVRLSTGWNDDRVRIMAVKEVPSLTDPLPGYRQDRGLWGLECMGMFRSYQEIDEYFEKYGITSYLGMAKDAVRPGMLIYKDNGGPWDPETRTYGAPDGIVSSDDEDGDMVRLSKWSDNPFGGTFNFGAKWRNFSFQGQVGASWGAMIMANTNIRKAASGMEFSNIPDFWKDMYVYENVYDQNGRVVAEANHDALYPNIQYDKQNNLQSSFWALNGTTISLNNVSLAYTASRNFAKKIGVESCRVNVTCQNALNFVSPHIADAWSSWGGTYGNYPNLRKISIGVNLSF